MNKGEIIIYQSSDGQTELDVRLEDDTVWLSQAQMANLLQVRPQNITMHIRNVYKEGELEQSATCKDFLQVQNEGGRLITRNIKFYNLDVIISVGYRVKSLRGTQFRIWANRVLKEYLIQGYAINRNAGQEQLEELKRAIAVMSNVLTAKSVTKDEAVGLLKVISDFAYGLDTLDRYDYQQLEVSHTTSEERFRATYESAMEALQELKRAYGASELFAREKDGSFHSTMGRYIKPMADRISTPASRRRQQTCCT